MLVSPEFKALSAAATAEPGRYATERAGQDLAHGTREFSEQGDHDPGSRFPADP
jgi:hypothetical protein